MAISGVTDYTNTYAADRANGSGALIARNGKVQEEGKGAQLDLTI